jgi:carboxypeptidase Taq
MTYALFSERLAGVNDLLNAMSILQWDSRTMMPPGGVETRAKQIATLTVAAREMLLSDETRRATESALREVESMNPQTPERRSVEQACPRYRFPFPHPRRPSEASGRAQDGRQCGLGQSARRKGLLSVPATP